MCASGRSAACETELRAASWRRSSSAVTSETLRLTVSPSVPSSATQPWPWRGAACGSQCAHSQRSAASFAEESTTSERSRGECRIAACAASQRAEATARSRSPATPTTPSSVSGSVSGTLATTGGSGCFSRPVPALDEVDLGGQVGEPDPQVQRVHVRDPPLPQPPARPRREEQGLCRVGEARAAPRLVARAQLGELLLVRREGLAVLLHLRAAPLLAVPPLAPPLPEHQQRGHEAEQQHVGRLHHEVHAEAEEERQDHGEELEPLPLRLAGLLGDVEPRPGTRRDQARRPVVGEAALPGRGQVGVGRAGFGEREHRVPAGQQRFGGPGALLADLLAVERERHGRGPGRR
ncbi:hypothetical protein GA0115252_14802 [Streptomyces sp. DfronAA-171]|nr:hypothetical protein GA0115252_14802 [Streptomyces sp. DfronAA-171]